MSHLSTPLSISAMIFYSLLTFFIGPYIVRPFISKYHDPCVGGFLVGFTISVILWMKFKNNLIK